MFEWVSEAEQIIATGVDAFEPEVLDSETAAKLVERFAHIERTAAAGKTLCAGRVADSGAWRKEGDRSAAHWVARTTKTSVGQAVGMLETASQMADLSSTDEAFRAGRLTQAQAQEITSAASSDPSAEQELLESADKESVSGLKEHCARVRAASLGSEAERHESIRRRRRLRHWRDHDGAFRLDALLTPESGGMLLAALKPLTESISKEAKKQGRNEPSVAYAADALVTLAEHGNCDDQKSGSGPKAMVQVLIDHSALTRGYLVPGERSEIAGVGPVAVATAKALMSDSILSAVVTKGVDISSISHFGRTIPAHLRTALMTRDQTCVVPGCDVRWPLQIDHIVGVGQKGLTRLSNLCRLCLWHHYLKTFRGYLLEGGVGSWRFGPPATSRGP
ncbi:MAG TPA: DUF222 domain-containing protein [Actinomycetota bacterium]|nr:DUF222 domain-containing protein [Actinomycetota bacterium]